MNMYPLRMFDLSSPQAIFHVIIVWTVTRRSRVISSFILTRERKCKSRVEFPEEWNVRSIYWSGYYYVGKSNRQSKVHSTEHKSNIRIGDEKSPVARHFNVVRHDVCELRFHGLEVVQPFKRGGDREKLLLQRETFYINVLQTQIPRGFNEELLSATGALFLYIILHLKLSKRCRSLPPQRIRWCKTFVHLSWKKISVSMFFFLSSGICLLIYKHLSWSSQNTSFYNQEVKPDNTKYKEETIEKT